MKPEAERSLGKADSDRFGERQDKLTPSEPQIDIGSGIAEQLTHWRQGVTPGPVVPFKPAAPVPAASTP